MPYRYLEDIATSDAAFEAWGETLEEMFAAGADAVMNVMVADLKSIETRERRSLSLQDEALDLLLFQLLQELVFYKDAEQLLLRIGQLDIERQTDRYVLKAEALGERIDPEKHELLADVKAVTLHRFQVEQTADGWKATVIVDV